MVSDKKYCPMTGNHGAGAIFYRKEKCAWWIDNTSTGTTKICAIPLATLRLNDIAYFIDLGLKED